MCRMLYRLVKPFNEGFGILGNMNATFWILFEENVILNQNWKAQSFLFLTWRWKDGLESEAEKCRVRKSKDLIHTEENLHVYWSA